MRCGGNNRARTCDPLLVRQVLSQLSYAPTRYDGDYYTLSRRFCQHLFHIFSLFFSLQVFRSYFSPEVKTSGEATVRPSVSRVLYWATIYLDISSPICSSDYMKRDGQPHLLPYQSCTGWGLQGGQVAKPPVSSYLAFPSLPRHARRFISVALSLESPPPDVIRHLALWCSDFPRVGTRGRLSGSQHLPMMDRWRK